MPLIFVSGLYMHRLPEVDNKMSNYIMKITDLPLEIIRNHIIPYTYSQQSDNLCRDITTFYFTYHKLMERQKRSTVYLDYYWFLSMLNSDILQFYREKILHLTEKEFCETKLYKNLLHIASNIMC